MELLAQVLDWILANGQTIVAGILGVIGGASVIAKLTPTPKDDAFLARLTEVASKIALNPKS